MKTIDKVRVYWLEDLLDTFLEAKELEHTRETEILFENELKNNNMIIDNESYIVIGYENKSFLGCKSKSYIKYIENYQEMNYVKIGTYSAYSSIEITWEHIYEELKQHEEYTDTYFKSEYVEQLVNGTVSYADFTHQVVNEFTIDYIKAFVLEDIKSKINNMTVDNLEWK